MIPRSAVLFSLAALTTGCATLSNGPDAATYGDPGAESNPAEIYDGVDDIETNLARLANLDVFEVGELIVDMPAEAFNCYGPCPGAEVAIAEAEADAAERLGAFTAAAIDAVNAPESDADVAKALEELRSLQIVGIGELIETVPSNPSNPYNSPNPEDIEAAEQENSERALKLEAIANAVHGL